jgi:hypothetical protein
MMQAPLNPQRGSAGSRLVFPQHRREGLGADLLVS